MFALYFALLFVTISLVVLHFRDRVLNDCVDRLYIFNYWIDNNLVQVAKFEAAGLGEYSQFYRDQIVRLDDRIKREARLYRALI
jgi:hypothetical protein